VPPTPPRASRRPAPARKPKRPASAEAAGEYAGVNSRTVRRWAIDGLITSYKLGPKLVRFDLDEIDRLFRPIPVAGPPDAA
jgi:excisionase family DNA binding protein